MSGGISLETVVNRLYEAMFLVDSALAASDWEDVNKVIADILGKAEAEVVSTKKWNECRLAYEIERKSRGTYILCYFKAAGDKIRMIERAVQLSDKIMRVLILNAEHLTQVDIDEETPATRVERLNEQAKAAREEREAKAAMEKSSEDVSEKEGSVEVSSDESKVSAPEATDVPEPDKAMESQKEQTESDVTAGDEDTDKPEPDKAVKSQEEQAELDVPAKNDDEKEK